DIIAQNDPLWGAVLNKFVRFSRVYGFEKIELPLLEDARLYENFYQTEPKVLDRMVRLDVAGRPSAVRAQFLPAVLRPYYQYKIFDKLPLSKWSYAGFCVLLDGKQANLVSDYQFGFEVFGGFNHLTEAQTIGAVWEFLQSLGLSEVSLEINHIGQ